MSVDAKKSTDAFGQSLWDYYKGTGSDFEIVERDDGYIEAGKFGPSAYFSNYKHWEPNEQKAVRLVRGRVLDVGCGAGRHALYFQKKGHDVLGIDTSPLCIKVCKLGGVRHIRLLSIDEVGKLRSTKLFDSIFMGGHNFGLFKSPTKMRRLLSDMARITSSNARIVAQSRDPRMTTSSWHKKYHRMNRAHGRMPGQVRLRIRFRGLIGPWFDYFFASPLEIQRLVVGTPWRVKQFVHDSGPSFFVILEKRNTTSAHAPRR